MVERAGFIEYIDYRRYPDDVMVQRARDFNDLVQRRRSVREFSDESVPPSVIKDCLLAAGSAPSGANLQPWHFVVVTDPDLKQQIREGAEREEYEFYHRRAPDAWLKALAPLGTDEHKPYLEVAPCLIAVFQQRHSRGEDGAKIKHYYAPESVGIATGMLMTALHNAGLACLPHTPSPMKFLNAILGRPESEKPFLLLVAGYPAMGVQVPDIKRKSLEDIATFL